MKRFRAVVAHADGRKEVVTGNAISEDLFVDELTRKGFYLISIKEAGKGKGFITFSAFSKGFVIDFTYNIYSLLNFGLDIAEALEVAKTIYPDGPGGIFVQEVAGALSRGERLSGAIAAHNVENRFDDFYISMVEAGEASGSLDRSFFLIHSFLVSREKLQSRIVSSAIYPLFLVIAAFGAIQVLLFFILPNFEKMYRNMQFKPNVIIKFMFDVSSIVRDHWIIYFCLLFVLIAGGIFLARTRPVRRLGHKVASLMPGIRTIYILQAKIKTAFSLEVLLESGTPLEEALVKLTSIEKSEKLSREIGKVAVLLKEGSGVAEAFKKLSVFNDRDRHLIEIADTTSRTSEGFAKIHEDGTARLEVTTERLTKLAEPAVMLFVAVFIGFIMYLVVMPTLGMMEQL